MKKKITTTIAGASAFITVFGLIRRSSGLVRESLYANYFGLSVEFDYYLIAAVIPLSINLVVIFIAQNYIVPNYLKSKQISSDVVRDFTNTAFWMFAIIAVLISLLLFLFSYQIIELYLQSGDTHSVNHTVLLFRIFILTIPLNAFYSVFASVLHSELQFKYPIYSQLIVNIIVILFVVLLNKHVKVLSIPLGYLSGTILQVIYIFLRVKPYLIPDFKKFLRAKKLTFFKLSLIMVVMIELLGQTYSVIDRYFFEYLEAGGIAALNYAFIIFNLPITVIAYALTTVLFPTLSRLSANNSLDEISNHLKNFFSINLFIFIPITLIVLLYGSSIVKIIFERGEFSENATNLTYSALVIYSTSFIFLSSYFILNKLFFSLGKSKALFFITLSGVFVKLILSWILVAEYKQDGLAFSTSLTFFFFFAISYVMIFKYINFKNFSVFFNELLFALMNGFIAYLVVVIIDIDALFNSQLITDAFNALLILIFYLSGAMFARHRSINFILNLMNNTLGTKLKISY